MAWVEIKRFQNFVIYSENGKGLQLSLAVQKYEKGLKPSRVQKIKDLNTTVLI